MRFKRSKFNSGVDINTQQSFEALNQRAVAVVIDPVQSVRGGVVHAAGMAHTTTL